MEEGGIKGILGDTNVLHKFISGLVYTEEEVVKSAHKMNLKPKIPKRGKQRVPGVGDEGGKTWYAIRFSVWLLHC